MTLELHKLIRSAIKSGDVAGLTKVLEDSPDAATMTTPFGSWLHVAASCGQLEIVKVLVENFHLDVNVRGGAADASALHRAAADGHYDVVEYLLDREASMDTTEPERNPLFGAILGGNVEIAKLLISRGIDKDTVYSGDHMTNMDALGFAKERGADEFVAILQ